MRENLVNKKERMNGMTEDIVCSIPQMLLEEIMFLSLLSVLNGIAVSEAVPAPILFPLCPPLEVVAAPSASPQLESQ